ncbi:MAG: hypothetical protein KAH44_04520 [Oricola sp.]|nr:hypothetical protein [Oricola sp.]
MDRQRDYFDAMQFSSRKGEDNAFFMEIIATRTENVLDRKYPISEGEIKSAARMRTMSLLLLGISPDAVMGAVPPHGPTHCIHAGFTVPRTFKRALYHERPR